MQSKAYGRLAQPHVRVFLFYRGVAKLELEDYDIIIYWRSRLSVPQLEAIIAGVPVSH